MGQKIKIDPVTRIEGHMAIEVEIEGGKVKEAISSGTMARGFEALLIGRDPRDASYVTSRFCGVCFSVHQLCSARAQDMAFGAKVPWGGELIRNLVMGAEYIYDHPLHFYQLSALDFIDIMAVANYKGKDKDLLAVKEKILHLVKVKDTYPFTPRYKPDEYCVRDPDIVIHAIKHYIDALKMHAKARNMGAIWGGRTPHYMNIIVGGVTSYPDVNQVLRFRSMLDEQKKFIEEVYIPDVIAFAEGPLFPLAKAGVGGGHRNYLACGDFPLDPERKKLVFPGGVIVNFDPKNFKVLPFDQAKITESVKAAWYKERDPVHPYDGEQVFHLEKKGAYTFIKAPRYDGMAFEVGPLARMLIAKNKKVFDFINKGAKPGVVLRHYARAIETKLIVDACYNWLDQLLVEMTKPGFKIHDTDHFEPPKEGMGYGFLEAPRGMLGHWIRIKDKKIQNYQAVVPSTWNISPRDEKGIRGQCEQALIGVPVPDPKNPINVVRVIRSFDPCIACAVHIVNGNFSLERFIIA
ncbi:MAG: nickel-dependent hydrogenase large subunit [Desulfobacterota bacterium]|nr:nickel-dependent hydrogenase large subunit [Thermodesulfobacteriota bacterium]MDW8002603.1 nickel-dependent hydrogenase large subunit [Deltaproteobacteria bacterium]